MIGPHETPSPHWEETNRRRRVEKEWRHEDFELTATYSVCRMVATVQAAFIPASGTMIGSDPAFCTKSLFILIVILSLCSIAGTITVPVLLARYHRYSAWYYGITGSGSAYPLDFDETNNEHERKERKKTYDNWIPFILYFGITSFVLSSVFFCMIVINR